MKKFNNGQKKSKIVKNIQYISSYNHNQMSQGRMVEKKKQIGCGGATHDTSWPACQTLHARDNSLASLPETKRNT